jgi:hypothetical protein
MTALPNTALPNTALPEEARALAYNNPSPYLPDLLIAHPGWAGAALQAVAGSANPPPDPARPAGTSPARGT